MAKFKFVSSKGDKKVAPSKITFKAAKHVRRKQIYKFLLGISLTINLAVGAYFLHLAGYL